MSAALQNAGLVAGQRTEPASGRFDEGEGFGTLREKYADYGPTLAAECWAAEDGIVAGVETLRRWLMAAGWWTRSTTKRMAYR